MTGAEALDAGFGTEAAVGDALFGGAIMPDIDGTRFGCTLVLDTGDALSGGTAGPDPGDGFEGAPWSSPATLVVAGAAVSLLWCDASRLVCRPEIPFS